MFEARFRAVCAAGGLAPVGAPRRMISYSNDAWTFDDHRRGPVVLRICWRGDRDRMRREVLLARSLPAAVRHAEVLDHGATVAGTEPVTWSLLRRLDGWSLDLRWAALTERERESVAAQLAGQLRVLHSWTPPGDVAAALTTRAPGGDANWVVNVDLLPLPLPRLHALVPYLRGLPLVDAGLVDAAGQALTALTAAVPALDDPARHGLVHHDLSLSNLWWSEDGALTLLDLEWSRFGPPDLELLQLCESAEADALLGDDAHPDLLRRLLPRYQDLAAAGTRLRLYALAYALRHLAIWRPDAPEDELDAYHPLRRLRRLLDGGWPTTGALPATLVSER